MSQIEFVTTVKGGLPVIAVVYVEPAESDLGIMSRSAVLEDLLWVSTRKPVTTKVFNSIPADDESRIEEEALEQ